MSEALNFLVHESSFYPDFFLVLHVSINTKYLPMETYWDISSLWSLDFKLLMQKRIFQNPLENEIIVLDKSMPGIKPWCKYSNTKKKIFQHKIFKMHSYSRWIILRYNMSGHFRKGHCEEKEWRSSICTVVWGLQVFRACHTGMSRIHSFFHDVPC